MTPDSEEGRISVPGKRPFHREEDYDEAAFPLLVAMQRYHFWYRGRHRFILRRLRRLLRAGYGGPDGPRCIDIGGGCGGWLEFLHDREPDLFSEMALGDSSEKALEMAGPVVGDFASRYLVDLMDLPWSGHWDVVFLLDVLEHIEEDQKALESARDTLVPGGLLLLTVPALEFFRSDNDRIVGHRRRYSRRDLRALAEGAGMDLLSADYFMFLLSPLLLLSRVFGRVPEGSSREDEMERLKRTHTVPPAPVNGLLSMVFALETPLSGMVRFPWGTSILGVIRKP